jgi:methanogenic corrinoid protein MtbC1
VDVVDGERGEASLAILLALLGELGVEMVDLGSQVAVASLGAMPSALPCSVTI